VKWQLQAAGGVLLLALAGGLAFHLQDQPRSLPPPVAAAPSPPAATPTPSATPAIARSAPVSLRIPAIGLTVSVIKLGLNPDHAIQLPDFHHAGWYKLGPSPGQPGSAVIIGHVDTHLGPAVFYNLRTLRPGNRIIVTLADGVTVRFAVLRVAMYLKTSFPTSLVYDPHGYSALQLVTCGGDFDSATGHYLSNVVVYSAIIS
jgi:sortase (surface protein transpeptidase)